MSNIIPEEKIENKIHLIRGQKVMLDEDLANLYDVKTKVLVQAVKRNKERFPQDFMFQLHKNELEILRSQNVTSSWGGRRYLPYAFTEQGVAMLSSVLKSKKAVKVNIMIMRAFVKLRRLQMENRDILDKMCRIGRKVGQHDVEIGLIIKTIEKMLVVEAKPKKRIGFLVD